MACKEQRNIFGVNNSLFFGERLGGGGGKYAPGKQEKVGQLAGFQVFQG